MRVDDALLRMLGDEFGHRLTDPGAHVEVFGEVHVDAVHAAHHLGPFDGPGQIEVVGRSSFTPIVRRCCPRRRAMQKSRPVR